MDYNKKNALSGKPGKNPKKRCGEYFCGNLTERVFIVLVV
jgi:hypothetical protein